MKNILFGLLGIFVGVACTHVVEDRNKHGHINLLNQHILDFNQHDAEALVSNMHPTFGWYQVTDGNLSIEANSQEALLSGMDGYFSSVPSVQSKISEVLTIGPYLATIETVQWKKKSGQLAEQAALSIYQFSDNKIKNVWYFPAVSDDGK